MKRLLIFVLLLSYLSTNAQLLNDLHKIYEPVYTPTNYKDSMVVTPFGIVKPGLNYGLSMGTGYSFFGGGMGMSASYIAPSITYSHNRLQVAAGITLSRTNMNGLPTTMGNGIIQQNSNNPYQAWAYTQYQFSNRFSMYAMGMFSQRQNYFSPYGQMGNFDSQQLGMGFSYRIGSNTTIGGSINFVRRNSGGLYNPYSLWGW